MFTDEKWFDQYVIGEKTTASMQNHVKQQTKTLSQDLCIIFHSKSWYGLESFLIELTEIVISSQKTYREFHKRIHKSKMTIEAIKNMEFSLIGPDIWALNSPDLNLLGYYFLEHEHKISKKFSFLWYFYFIHIIVLENIYI